MPMSDMVTPLQAALILQVSTRTITRWADDESHPLTIAEWTAGGQRRFLRSAVEQIAKGKAS